MNPNRTYISSVFKNLPDEIKDAVVSVDTARALQTIGEKYALRIDKIGELADEAGLVMMGITHPDNFTKNLMKRLELPEEKVKEIVKEVNEKIFQKIREPLKKIQSQEEIEEKPEKIQKREETPQTEGQTEKVPPDIPSYQQDEGNIPANLPTGDISSLKLSRTLKIPKEEQSTSPETRPTPEAAERGHKADPYREPIE